MIRKDMLLVAVLLSGIVQADCPDYSSCPKKYDSCSQECNPAVECDTPCYRMCATLYMDDVQLEQRVGPVKGGPVMFEDYGVQVMVVEEREDGVVVQVSITNPECPMSKDCCKDECRALPVEDGASDEPCEPCLQHVPWGQEVVVSCANCKYSMRIAVEKSE